MRTEGNGRTADAAYTHGAYVFYAQRPRRTTFATTSRRPTDATDGIDQRRRRQCACLPRSHAKALTGKKNAQTPASMPAKPQAPSVFGGQKRCIQQSPPRMLGAIQPLSSRRSAQVFTHCDTNQGRNRHRRKTSPKRSFSRVCHPRAAASGSAGISTDR